MLALLGAGSFLPAQTYKNTRAGFALSPPDKWIPTPVPPDDKTTAAKWVSKNPVREITVELLVMVFDKVDKKKAAAEGSESAPSYGDDPLRINSYQKYCEFAGGRKSFKWEKPKEMTVKGTTAKARVWDQNIDAAYHKGNEVSNAWVGVAIIDTPERQFALELMAPEGGKDKLQPIFQSVVKSFKVLSADEVDADEDEAALAGMSEKDKARRTAELSKRQVPGWWSSESANYIILTNLKPDKTELINTLKSRLEKMRKIYLKDFPPVKPVDAVSIVRICATKKDYHSYGGPPSSAGYWNSRAEELVLYTGGPKDETLAVLNHEAFHQYIFYCFGELAPHSWYNEGYGDYYSGAEPEGSGLKVKPFKWRTETIKGAITGGTFVPINKIIRYTQQEYYANGTLCYAEGWSIIWFLNKGLPAKHPWRTILPTYFDAIRETRNPERAVEAAFKDVDMPAFEKAWAAFITKDTPAPMMN